MSKQTTTDTSLAIAKRACQQAGVILLEISHKEMTFDGAITCREGQPLIIVRDELSAVDKAKVASQLLEVYSARKPKVQRLKRKGGS